MDVFCWILLDFVAKQKSGGPPVTETPSKRKQKDAVGTSDRNTRSSSVATETGVSSEIGAGASSGLVAPSGSGVPTFSQVTRGDGAQPPNNDGNGSRGSNLPPVGQHLGNQMLQHSDDESEHEILESLETNRNNAALENQPSGSEQRRDQNVRTTKPQESAEAKQFRSLQRAVHRLAGLVRSDQIDMWSYDGVCNRIKYLDGIWNEANTLYKELIGHAEDHMSEAYEDCKAILEEEYFETSDCLRRKMSELAPAPAGPSVSGNEAGTPNQPFQLIMPVQQHNIPNTWGHFDGDLTKWLGFRDRFTKAIHEETGVSDAWKHSHLLRSLEGKAKEALGKTGTVEGTYQEAWDRLCELYHKPYNIARHQLREFLKLPYLAQQATTDELQRMSNITHETIRQMRALEFPVDSWDFLFVHCLHERLDPETARQWNLLRESERPTAKEMTKFLDREAGASNRIKMEGKPDLTVTIDNRPKGNQNNRPSTSTGRSTGAVPRHYPCEACPGGHDFHKMHACPNYLSLSFNGRKDFIARRRLCPNCLKRWHPKDQCRDPTCPFTQCARDPFHNSTICPFKVPNALVGSL